MRYETCAVASGAARWSSVLPALWAGLFAATTAGAHAADPAREPLSLAWVPRDTVLVCAARPAELLRRPALARIAEAVRSDGGLRAHFGVAVDRVETATVVFLPAPVDSQTVVPGEANFVLRLLEPVDVQQLAGLLGRSPSREKYAGREYFKGDSPPAWVCAIPEPRTVLISRSEADLRRLIVAGESGAARAPWAQAWGDVAPADAAVLCHVAVLRPALDRQRTSASRGFNVSAAEARDAAARGMAERGAVGFGGGRAPEEVLAQFAQAQAARSETGRAVSSSSQVLAYLSLPALSPLWTEGAATGALDLELTEDLGARLIVHCASAESAAAIVSGLRAAIVPGKNTLASMRQTAASRSGDEGPLYLKALDVVDQLIDGLRVEQDDTRVVAGTRASVIDAAQYSAALVPAMKAAAAITADAQAQVRARNNLRQIAIAFRNFHDAYGRFPPAVVTRRGQEPLKHPHSWRVAILPYVDGAALYNEYRFDEPWDSDHNLTILARMPDVFRHPGDDAGSTNASYFALAGPGSAFDREGGTALQEITDGTSNTILVVESKARVPWTKPEDIPFDPDEPLADLLAVLGGWQPESFQTVMCDGAVRSFPRTLPENVLKLLITRSGGEPVPAEFVPPQEPRRAAAARRGEAAPGAFAPAAREFAR